MARDRLAAMRVRCRLVSLFQNRTDLLDLTHFRLSSRLTRTWMSSSFRTLYTNERCLFSDLLTQLSPLAVTMIQSTRAEVTTPMLSKILPTKCRMSRLAALHTWALLVVMTCLHFTLRFVFRALSLRTCGRMLTRAMLDFLHSR